MNLSWIDQSFKNNHSRSSGNVFNQSLDSGLRRAAPGLLPSRRIQDFLSINDGVARIKAIKAAGLRLSFRRHSSEGWNPRLHGCRW